MKHIILDTNILLNFPEVLSFKRVDTKLIIPDHVFSELASLKSPRAKDLNNLLQRAINEQIVTISSTAVPREQLHGNTAVGYVDYTILGYARFLQEQGNDVTFATDDKKLAILANTNAIKTFSSNDLIAYYSAAASTKDKEIQEKVEEIENKERWGILINLILALLFIAFIIFFARNFGDIIDRFTNVLWIILLVIGGFLLFEIREKRRQLYGFAEVGFGILTIAVVFYPDLILEHWDSILKTAAGLYVIVRGLDNLYKGSEKRKLGPVLKKFFRLK